jgi:hypothetical protein
VELIIVKRGKRKDDKNNNKEIIAIVLSEKDEQNLEDADLARINNAGYDHPCITKYKMFHILRSPKGWEIALELNKKHPNPKKYKADIISWLDRKGIKTNRNDSFIRLFWDTRRVSLWSCKIEDNPDITPSEIAKEAIELLNKMLR